VGPDPGEPVDSELLQALRRRLHESSIRYDALVLAAAGTRDATARSTVVRAALALGTSLGVPCVAAYASAADPAAGDGVAALRAGGARRVAVASYFLAPGFLHDRALSSAFAAGAAGASAPLGGAPELARLVLARTAMAVAVPACASRDRI
jgi:sirohydrochlorin ferrochelatase